MCTGSQAGTLKIWDLEAARLVRTHTGEAYSSSRRDNVHRQPGGHPQDLGPGSWKLHALSGHTQVRQILSEEYFTI
jgi:hypothetical protein